MKKIKCIVLCLLVTASLFVPTALAAQSTTYTWALDRKGNFVRTQDAYLPDRTVTDLMLKEPEDLFITGDNLLYISDSGNRRIVVYDINRGVQVREITHPSLQRPRGIHVTQDMEMYVADSAASAVFRFCPDDELIQTFKRPVSAAFGDTPYSPMRVAVDNRGSLYIIGEGVASGVIQLSVTGEFLGFFTSNRVTLTFAQLMQNIFFTDAQMSNLQDRIPGTFSNVYTDQRGIVYTVTMGRDSPDNVKKHNMRGGNMFAERDIISFRSLSDITTDKNGVIYVTDSRGWVAVYSPEGEFIFYFGGYSLDDVAGLYSYLTAIAVEDDGTLWTLDYDKAYLQSYSPTEYTLSIYEALALFNQGRYAEAEDTWKTVLRYNQTSILAHDGIGKANLYRQNYTAAQYHFELAGNREFYSQAFWEVRNAWLQENLIWFMAVFMLWILLSLAIRYIDRKKRLKLATVQVMEKARELPVFRTFAFATYIMRHPLDGYYDMKLKTKGTYGGATLLICTLFISMMLWQTSKAYILQTTAVEDMNLAAIVGGFFGLVLLFILCNYLVTSINDGEGTIGEIYKMIAYASLPLTLAFIIITIISYVMTFNELFLVNLTLAVGTLWFGVIFYLGLQEIHNYNFKNTIKSILFTAGFIVLAIIALLVLTILFQQMLNFIEALGMEAYYFATGTV